MAEKLDAFPEESGPQRGRYDWNSWLNGDVWKLNQGEDFTVETKSFRSAVQQATRNRNGKVRTSLVGEKSIVFQFVKDEDNAETPVDES